jgi:hypothetical protein
MPVPKQQYFDSTNQRFLAGGKLYTYAAGTTTPKATYTDSAGTTPQTNPIVLNARGEPDNPIYWDGAYKVVLKDADGSTIYTVDNYKSDPFGIVAYIASVTSSIGSTLIGFIQAGAGAILRTVQDKLRERISVADFGAVGDGVTDDTNALLAAIAYGKLTNKRVELIDGCTYITSAPLYLDSSGAIGCSKARGATIKKTTNTVGTGSNSVSGTPISYAVDAVIIVRFPNDDFAYNVDIDGVNIDALSATNAYGIYAPRISQSRIRNGYMSGVRTGVYSANIWLTTLENMNISCGDPASTSTVPASSVAYNLQTGTSVAMRNCWARVCETGFRTNNLSYSAMTASVCEFFTLTAFEFTGSNIDLAGCGAESSVGSGASLFKLSNSRVVVDAMQTFALANMVYFFWLSASEAQVNMPRIANDTAGVGTTFFMRSSSSLYVDGRQYPTNTATVYDYDSGNQVIVKDRDNGIIHRFWDTAANANNWGTPTGKVSWGIVTPRGTLYGTTTPKASVEGTGFGTSIFALVGNNTGTGNPGEIALGKTRSSTVGGVTIVANGDTIGTLSFHGADGSVMANGASISAVVDGSPAAGDMPARLSFSTRPSAGSLTERLRIKADGTVRPGADNTQTLGEAATRWSVVYAGTGAINTSDEDEKQQVQPIYAAALRAVRRVNLVQFKFNDAVERKGDGARWHFGVIAQQVREAFEAEGLDAFAYGLLCYDEWPDQPEVLSDDSTVLTPYRPAGNRYGVRYEELFALKLAALMTPAA